MGKYNIADASVGARCVLPSLDARPPANAAAAAAATAQHRPPAAGTAQVARVISTIKSGTRSDENRLDENRQDNFLSF